MTALGGLGHTLPYLISDFWTATYIAIAIVFVELWIIAGIRARFMDTQFLRAALEVVVGGSIVFAVGVRSATPRNLGVKSRFKRLFSRHYAAISLTQAIVS